MLNSTRAFLNELQKSMFSTDRSLSVILDPNQAFDEWMITADAYIINQTSIALIKMAASHVEVSLAYKLITEPPLDLQLPVSSRWRAL